MKRQQQTIAAVGASPDLEPEAYFTYRPLSNLPTPPPSTRESTPSHSYCTSLDHGEVLKPALRGPAIHLVNLIPSSSSLAFASVPLVQAFLTRAALPIETVALAVCILDSLDARFARTWRLACPLQHAPSHLKSKRHSLPHPPMLERHQQQEQHHHQQQQRQRQQLHIDLVSPELIVLAALVIAVKFADDPQQSTQLYCGAWGRDLWSHDQLNVTERCIMENLDYRIMHLWDDDCLTGAMVDMQLAGQQEEQDEARQVAAAAAAPMLASLSPPVETLAGREPFVPSHSRSKTMSTGKATGFGLAITPMDTPAMPRHPAADYFDQGGA